MELSNLTKWEKTAGGGGVLLLVASFLPWYGFGGLIGWSSGFLAWGGILAGVAGAGVLIAPKLGGKEISTASLARPQLAVVLSGIGTALIILRFLTTLQFFSFGIFAGLAGAALAAYGSFQAMREAGLELPVDEIRERFTQPSSASGPEETGSPKAETGEQ
ncbi:MAG TPA: hypothetical protein EYP73_01750 [Acidimicrobiia bacterium]|nr:hypothetical protein [Acidimicrobiia bacterium]